MRNKHKARTLEVIVHADGCVVIDAIGFSGTHCENVTPFLEEALGMVTAKQKKPEYYERSARQRKRQQSIGGAT